LDTWGAKKKGPVRTVSPATVRRHYAPVRALFATAYEDGAIPRNPAQGVRVIVRDDRPRVPMRLTPAQTTALLGKMPGDHADLAYLLAATGVRISEALGTTWANVGRDADGIPTLTIARSKTRAGERTIPLSPETAGMLARRRTVAEFDADTDPIFPNATGAPMDDHNYRRRVFKPAAKRAGVPWATPHKLRHGMASLMAEHGYGAADIAATLGHADGGVLALKTYIHPKVRAVDFVDDVLAGRADTNADTTRPARG
jgi:integrase